MSRFYGQPAVHVCYIIRITFLSTPIEGRGGTTWQSYLTHLVVFIGKYFIETRNRDQNKKLLSDHPQNWISLFEQCCQIRINFANTEPAGELGKERGEGKRRQCTAAQGRNGIILSWMRAAAVCKKARRDRECTFQKPSPNRNIILSFDKRVALEKRRKPSSISCTET